MYSFPSKNMEYLVSGTPVLSTKLKCIPKEYYKYFYFFEDESLDGFIFKIKEIINKDRIELFEFGKRSRNWVLENKNNIIQTKKIIDMIQKE